MSLNHSPSIVTDGLVLCLDAANKRSYPGTGTAWTDLKGVNNGSLDKYGWQLILVRWLMVVV